MSLALDQNLFSMAAIACNSPMGGKVAMEQEIDMAKFEAYAFDCMDMVYSEALRLTGSLPEAESLVQATYQNAYERFNEPTPQGKTCRWILSILKNEFQLHTQEA
jgi:DNA-directed RNA polymerase specialized sigma24 family protein